VRRGPPRVAEALAEPVNALERDHDPDGVWRAHVNAALAGPYRALFARLDLLVLFTAPDFDTVLAWRQEQEAKLRDRLAGGAGRAGQAMSEAEVAVFVQHYERLTRHIAREMPARADLVIGSTRTAVRRSCDLPFGRAARRRTRCGVAHFGLHQC
jgi:D-glycerate 3-kinase